MAMSDYYLCDVCGDKAFYDANITDSRYCATYDPTEDADPIGILALCSECNKTHELIIRPLAELTSSEAANGEHRSRCDLEAKGGKDE